MLPSSGADSKGVGMPSTGAMRPAANCTNWPAMASPRPIATLMNTRLTMGSSDHE